MARYFVGGSPMVRSCRAEGTEKGKGVVASGQVIARHLQEIIDAWHKQFGD